MNFSVKNFGTQKTHIKKGNHRDRNPCERIISTGYCFRTISFGDHSETTGSLFFRGLEG